MRPLLRLKREDERTGCPPAVDGGGQPHYPAAAVKKSPVSEGLKLTAGLCLLYTILRCETVRMAACRNGCVPRLSARFARQRALNRAHLLRAWRNGRRAGFRFQCPQRRKSSSLFVRTNSNDGACGSSSVVECHLAKVDVASPNLVYRSIFFSVQVVRPELVHAGVAQWQSSSLPSWPRGFDSHHPLQSSPRTALSSRRRFCCTKAVASHTLRRGSSSHQSLL